MKRLLMTIALALPLLMSGHLAAQPFSQDIEQREYARQFYTDYSRWSLGVNASTSVMWGDLKSFAYEETYMGGLFGVEAGYQFTPTIGLALSGSYGINKAGATSKNRNYVIQQNGFTYHGVNPPAGSTTYDNIYTKVESWHIGLNVDINLNNLFCGNDGKGNRKWTVIASPGVYLQYFKPILHNKADDTRFTTSTLHYDWSFGLGGDAAVRYKLSKVVDLELKGGAIWVLNNKFDGVASATNRYINGYAFLGLGATFKLNCGDKKDNLLYAPTSRYVNKTFAILKEEIHHHHKKVIERPVEKIVYVKTMPTLPSIHFVRGSMDIDEVKFARELREIVNVLNEFPDTEIRIHGYADHVGGEQINDTISFGRAEALRNYLVSQGIAVERIVDVKGFGRDPGLQGDAAYTVIARRAEVVRN